MGCVCVKFGFFFFLHLNSFSGMSPSDLSFAHFVYICRTSTDLLGTLRKHDGDDNEDVKKQMFHERNKSSARMLLKKLKHSFDVFC